MPLLICPNCNLGMTQVQRSGIEFDMCPQCRGVWLDRGELEKLLEPCREESAAGAAQPSFLAPAGPAWGQAAAGRQPAGPSPGHDGEGHHHRPAHDYDRHEHDAHRHDRHHDAGHQDGRHGWHGDHRKKGWRNLLEIFD